ncbi:hypothetical protein C6503_14760 [Candidatus Poribacteria bacterium]|nr:MAG: hypothetical protein C6503_14760 [Candidatus Poribacteria bacterium]
MIFPNTLTLGRGLKICIAINLCCYVALLGVIELTHDHDHCEHAHSAETCTACVYNSQHVGEEIEVVILTSPFLPSTTLPLYETVFLPLKLITNTRSRAPPIFSNQLTNFAS